MGDYGDLDDEDYGKPIMGRAKSRPNIILKIRVANTSDPDFIEIDLPRRKLKLHSLIVALCEELEVQTKMVEKVRKLPNTRMRRDIEVRRLLRSSINCCEFENYSSSLEQRSTM